jgi:hypothetical protein
MRRFVALCLIGLFLAMQFVVAHDNIGPYDRAADVNRDGIVDIIDLTQVGQAYGSNYTLRSQANTTVITVASFAMSPPEVENTRVAIFSRWPTGGWTKAISFEYTNASGIAVFELSPNSSYRAVAWRTIPEEHSSSYSYTDFETNSFGEVSSMVVLGEPEVPSVQLLPALSIVFTLLNKTTGLLYDYAGNHFYILVDYSWYGDDGSWHMDRVIDGFMWITPHVPIFVMGALTAGWMRDGPGGFMIVVKYTDQVIGSSAFQLTEDLSANVIIYVPSSP